MLKKFAMFFFLPPVFIGFISLAPFIIYWSDFLSAKARYVSQRVGFDSTAFQYACLCVGAFSLIFFFVFFFFVVFPSRRGMKRRVVLHRPRKTRRLIFIMVGIFAFVGLGVTVFSVSRGGPGYINEMAGRLKTGESATDLLYGSQAYMRNESVSGLFRMFGGWSTAAVLVWLALAASPWRNLIKKMYWPGLSLLLAANFVRGVLGGDRGPTLVAFLLTAYIVLIQIRKRVPKSNYKGRFLRKLGMAVGLTIIIGVGLWAYARLDKLRNPEGYNTFLLYSDMGVANLSLEMKTGHGMGYGYFTFGGPLWVIFKFFGINAVVPQFTYDYIEGPYLNLLGYAYADFGFFGFVIYGFLGLLSGWVYLKMRRHPSRLVWRVTHLYILWALSSAFMVPIFTGMSYWAGLFGAIAVSIFLDARLSICAIPGSALSCQEKTST